MLDYKKCSIIYFLSSYVQKTLEALKLWRKCYAKITKKDAKMIYVTFVSYLQFLTLLSSCNDQVKIKVFQRRTLGSNIIRGREMSSLMNLTAEIYRAQLNQTAHWSLMVEGRRVIEQIFSMHIFSLKSKIWCMRMIF